MSAVLAVLFGEPDAGRYEKAIAEAWPRRMSAVGLLEAAMVVESRGGIGQPHTLHITLLDMSDRLAMNCTLIPHYQHLALSLSPTYSINPWIGNHTSVLISSKTTAKSHKQATSNRKSGVSVETGPLN